MASQHLNPALVAVFDVVVCECIKYIQNISNWRGILLKTSKNLSEFTILKLEILYQKISKNLKSVEKIN